MKVVCSNTVENIQKSSKILELKFRTTQKSEFQKSASKLVTFLNTFSIIHALELTVPIFKLLMTQSLMQVNIDRLWSHIIYTFSILHIFFANLLK